VHAVLYLLFNEGYLSAHPRHAIRRELCDEAATVRDAAHARRLADEAMALVATALKPYPRNARWPRHLCHRSTGRSSTPSIA
jgi:predicted RNA polymerase sigma factor